MVVRAEAALVHHLTNPAIIMSTNELMAGQPRIAPDVACWCLILGTREP